MCWIRREGPGLNDKGKSELGGPHEQGHIGAAELAAILVMATIAKTFLTGPERLGRNTQTSAWWIALLGGALAFSWIYPLIWIAKKHPGKNALDVSLMLLGPFVTYPLTFAFSSIVTGLNALTARQITAALITAVIPRSALEPLLAVIVLTSMYFALQSTETLGRLCLVSACVFVPAVLLLVLATIPLWNVLYIFPVAGPGFGNLLPGLLLRQGAYAEFMALGLYVMFVKKPAEVRRGAVIGLALTTFTLFSVALGTQMVLPYPSIAHSSLPFLRIAKTATLGRFLQRLDPILVVAWLGIGLSYGAILQQSYALAVSRLLGLKTIKPVVVVNAIVVYIVARLFSSFSHSVIWDFDILRPLTVPFLVIWPWALVIMTKIRESGEGRKKQ